MLTVDHIYQTDFHKCPMTVPIRQLKTIGNSMCENIIDYMDHHQLGNVWFYVLNAYSKRKIWNCFSLFWLPYHMMRCSSPESTLAKDCSQTVFGLMSQNCTCRPTEKENLECWNAKDLFGVHADNGNQFRHDAIWWEISQMADNRVKSAPTEMNLKQLHRHCTSHTCCIKPMIKSKNSNNFSYEEIVKWRNNWRNGANL